MPVASDVPRWLPRLRLAARSTLWLEQASAAIWPAAGVLGGFACLALLGVPQSLPAPLHAGLLLLLAAALVWAVRRARPGLRWPGAEPADRRLERAAGLSHRPLAVLADRPAGPDGPDVALWAPHRARALAQLGRLRLGWPEPALPGRDKRALRLLLLLGLTISVVVAGPEAGDRLARALWPHFAAGPAAARLEVRAGVAPPAFTGLPPSLLPEGGAVGMPSGSRLTISLSGGEGRAPSLDVDGGSRGFDAIGADSFQAQAEPAADGPVVVRRDGAEVARWVVTLQPNLAPVVAWARPPAVLGGRPPRLRLAWKASHSYGVAALAAEFRLQARPDAPPFSLPIPLSGRPREAAGTVAPDLTAHPWAGLPVTVRLSGRDGQGLVGTGAAASLVLPARRFRQPAAQALVAVRQRLSLAPAATEAAAAALREAAGKAELWPPDDPGPAAAREIAAALPRPDADIDAAQRRLWELAVRLEEQTPQRTAEALRKAQQELRAALDPKAARDKAEIEKRAQALARALQSHQQALDQQARRDPGSVTPPTAQERAALDKALQRLRDAAQAERMDEARERMAELDEMLSEMRRSSRGEAQKKKDEGRQKGQAQLTAVQDLTRREGGLIDHAEARLADPSPADQAPARDHDRAVQFALRRVLGELMQQHGDLTGAVPKNLGEADTAMREAAGALADGRDDAASAAALRAVEALQQGGQEMSQQLARQFGAAQNQPQPGEEGDQQADGDGQPGEDGQQFAGEGQDGQEPGDGAGQAETGEEPGDGTGGGRMLGPDGKPVNRGRDPFGRATREGLMGTDGGRDTKVPDQMEQARGRAVQDELRRREAQRTRPQQELDYIGRLLKPE